MILEAVHLHVIPGQELSFERDFVTASQYIQVMPGYIRHSLSKCMEVSHKYLLLVEWETLEAHTVGFRQSEEYLEWKKLLHHYYHPFPVAEHYTEVYKHRR